MELTAQDLMFLFDAVVAYTIRPEIAALPNMEAWSESVALKLEAALNDMGYRFDGPVDYTVV